MMLSLRKNGLTSLFEEVRVFKECRREKAFFLRYPLEADFQEGQADTRLAPRGPKSQERPDFLAPATCDFSHAIEGKWPLSRVLP